MATYLHKSTANGEDYQLNERMIYGSARLGVEREPVSMPEAAGSLHKDHGIPGYRVYELEPSHFSSQF